MSGVDTKGSDSTAGAGASGGGGANKQLIRADHELGLHLPHFDPKHDQFYHIKCATGNYAYFYRLLTSTAAGAAECSGDTDPAFEPTNELELLSLCHKEAGTHLSAAAREASPPNASAVCNVGWFHYWGVLKPAVSGGAAGIEVDDDSNTRDELPEEKYGFGAWLYGFTPIPYPPPLTDAAYAVVPNRAEARKWWERARELGSRVAANNLCIMEYEDVIADLRSGKGIAPEYSAANDDDSGDGKVDFVKKYAPLSKRVTEITNRLITIALGGGTASTRCPVASHNLGIFHYMSVVSGVLPNLDTCSLTDVPKPEAEATAAIVPETPFEREMEPAHRVGMRWFRFAASCGDSPYPPSIARLAQVDLSNRKPRHKAPKDGRTGDMMMMEAANMGYAEAAFNVAHGLAHSDSKGEAGAQDDRDAVKFLTAAARQGFVLAYQNLAGFHSIGRSVPKSIDRAIELAKRSAAAGDNLAMITLGALYEQKCGTNKAPTPDRRRSFRWFLRAAKAGHPQAIRKIGYCYESGEGTAMALEKALLWYKLGAAIKAEGTIEAFQQLAGKTRAILQRGGIKPLLTTLKSTSGVAIDVTRNVLYVADSHGASLIRMDLKTGERRSVLDASIRRKPPPYPFEVAIDPTTDSLYVTEPLGPNNSGLHRVSLVSSDGELSAVGTAGGLGSRGDVNDPSWYHPLGVYVDSMGGAYFTEKKRVRKYDPFTRTVTTLAVAAPGPEDDTSSSTAKTAAAAAGASPYPICPYTNKFSPHAIAVDDISSPPILYISNENAVWKLELTADADDAGASGAAKPKDATSSAAASRRVRRMEWVAGSKTGEGGNVDGVVSVARFDSPMQFLWDAAFNMLITDHANGCVKRINFSDVNMWKRALESTGLLEFGFPREILNEIHSYVIALRVDTVFRTFEQIHGAAIGGDDLYLTFGGRLYKTPLSSIANPVGPQKY